MRHDIAVELAKIVNEDLNRMYLAYVCKEDPENLKITDDWFVKISERE